MSAVDVVLTATPGQTVYQSQTVIVEVSLEGPPGPSGSGGGGGGAVDSVNTQTGDVVLGATDVGAPTIAAFNSEASTRASADTANAAAITAEASTARTAEAAAVTTAAGDATTKANAAQAFAIQRANHTGTESADVLTDGTTNKAFLATERTKLAGVATGATANSSDAVLEARANHTGTQSADTLTDGTTNKAFLATERTKLAAISGTNTGDQTLPTSLPPNGSASGDLSGTYPSPTVAKVNGTALSGLGTGLLKNTTGTGVPSIAVASDIPNLAASQITSGVLAIGRLATGTPTGAKFVRDDGTLATPSAGGVPTFAANSYLGPPFVGTANSASQGVNFMRAIPLDLPFAVTCIAIGINVQTGVATSLARLGIYSDVAGVPTTLLVDAGTVNCATTGNKEATVSSLALPAGRVWLTACSQTAAVTAYTAQNTATPINGTTAGMVDNSGVSAPGYYNSAGSITGAFPGSFGTPAANIGSGLFRVYIKVA